MTVGEIANQKSRAEKGEKELILAHVLNCSREYVITHPEREISPAELRKYRRLLKHRADGEPFAYVIGEKWFYGRAFKVTPATLIPRPETETLVEAVLETTPKAATPATTLVDVGTGSGAIAITLAAERPDARVIALDVSPSALRIAKQNAKQLGAKVEFLKGDITKPNALKKLPKAGRLVIAANLPYLKDDAWPKLGVGIRKFEPRLALTSGRDGLDHYRALMKRIEEAQLEPACLLLEADPPQFTALKKIVQSALPKYHFEIKKDLYGDPRVLVSHK